MYKIVILKGENKKPWMRANILRTMNGKKREFVNIINCGKAETE